MGTYTTNYNLFMPSIGETGWGTLVNGNFSTIDTTMKSLSNRITSVENEVNGALSCTSVTTSGKVTANGGLSATTGTFSGAINGVTLKSSGVYTVRPTSTLRGYIHYGDNTSSILLIPPKPGVTYTGTLKFRNTSSNRSLSVTCFDANNNDELDSTSVTGVGDCTLTFTNLPYVEVWVGLNQGNCRYYDFTLT